MDIKTTSLSYVLLIFYALIAFALAKMLSCSASDVIAWMAISFIASRQAKELLSEKDV